jgi:hypothetical protein
MTLTYEDDDVTNEEKKEFTEKLRWFEDEFDLIFNKTHSYTNDDIKLANQLLNKFSETINEFRHEKYLYSLTRTLNNIEKKYPEFF